MARYKFDQIAHYLNEKRMPTEADRETYIGLEHLDSGNLTVTRWGSDVDIKGQKLVMHKGDILFGRRNTYLKRAAIAPHDGLFSAHGMIWRPKEDIVDAGFFPFFVSSDYFMDEAIRISVGSLSPTINWRDLKELEFDLPDIDTQRKLSTLLWAMERAKTAYKNLIAKTDELVKSQFVEMFGDPLLNPNGLHKKPLANVANIMSGITKGRKTKATTLRSVPYICTANVQDGYIDWSETKYIDASEDEIHQYALAEDDILMIEGGDPDKVGRGHLAGKVPNDCIYQNHVFRVRMDQTEVLPEFMAAYITLPRTKEYFLACAKQTTGIATINKRQLSELQVMYPDLSGQMQYIEFVRQADKSKFAAQQALADLTATQKALMRQYLG